MKTPDNERLNFRRFVPFEQRERVHPFDAEKELTESDKELMRGELKRARKEKRLDQDIFGSELMRLQILGVPGCEPTEEDIERLQGVATSFSGWASDAQNNVARAKAAAQMILLGFSPQLDDSVREELPKCLDAYRLGNFPSDVGEYFSDTVFTMRVLGMPVEVSADDWQRLHAAAEELREMKSTKTWQFSFMRLAVAMKLIGDTETVIRNKDWDEMRRGLELARTKSDNTTLPGNVLITFAWNMKILAAERVELSEGKLVLIQKSFSEKVPPPPVIPLLP